MYCQFLSEEASDRFQKTNFGLNQHNFKLKRYDIYLIDMMLQNSAGNLLPSDMYFFCCLQVSNVGIHSVLQYFCILHHEF